MLQLRVPLRVASLVPSVSVRLRIFAEGYGSSAGAKASGSENHVSMHVPSRLGCKDPLDCGALVPVFCLSSHHRCDRTLPSIQKSCLRASPMTTTKAMSSSTKRAAASTNSRHLVASTIELLSSNGHRERRRRSRSTSVDISATYPLASIHVVPKRRLKKMSYAEECVLDQIDDCLAVSHSHTFSDDALTDKGSFTKKW